MSPIVTTDYSAKITWLGTVPEDAKGIRSASRTALTLTYAGADGDVHSGLTRPSCVRVTCQYPEGTEIANVRQISIVSAEELALIAADMGIDAVDPAWLGATMVVEGIPDFTHVTPSARLQGPDGACVVIDMENLPCLYPAKEVDKDLPGVGKRFKSAAAGRRGVTAWVERPGTFKLGDALRLHVPVQRAWQPKG
ncbi:MOSC domain-containing protein [Rhodobacteraceae bacterium KMM 6894]|nr:MOSC domain-containing protein [Rhodobacteraceae bacterium KMM 6894]